jgi:tRNA threonylcarbamoyladenosine biosynthesis protein TsaE
MDIDCEIVTKSPEETATFGKILSDAIVRKQTKGELSGPVVICLYGDLGSGKTTFVQGLLHGLGIATRVLSPTFIIVRRYDCPQLHRSISHIDCYRLSNIKDIEGLGFPDVFADPSGLVLVEWAERLGDKLPENRMDITFDVRNDTHILTVTKDSYGFTG